MFRCPNDIVPRDPGFDACTYGFCCSAVSYGGVYGRVYRYNAPPWEVSKNITAVTHPAGFVCVTETENDDILAAAVTYGYNNYWALNGSNGPNNAMAGTSNFASPWPSNTFTLRHGDNGNVAFADGHAKSINTNMTCTAIESVANCVQLDNMYYTSLGYPPS